MKPATLWSLVVVGVSALTCAAGYVAGSQHVLGRVLSPSAMSVCQKLVKVGVATHCVSDTPGGLGAAAVESVGFELADAPGKKGQVLAFDHAEHFDRTFAAFAEMAALAGPHRYGNRTARVFVQMNAQASPEAGSSVLKVLQGL